MSPEKTTNASFCRKKFILGSLAALTFCRKKILFSEEPPLFRYFSASFSRNDPNTDLPIRKAHPIKVICLYDPEQDKAKIIQVPIYVHSFAIHPSGQKLIGVPKSQSVAVEIDLVSGLQTQIQASKGYAFYGHAQYLPHGQQWLACEAKMLEKYNEDTSNNEGKMVIRNGSNQEILGDFPSYGQDPHDMNLIENGQTLACVNGGKKSNIT